MGLKETIKSMLEAGDYPALVGLSAGCPRVARLLVSMTYDKTDALSWRALEALGRVTAPMPSERVRVLLQRVLWMMREESGNSPWSAPAIIGEIVASNPEPFLDFVPIVVSFHDEGFLREGVLWAMKRLAEARPDLVAPFRDVPVTYLGSESPTERGYSVLVLAAMGGAESAPLVERLLGDTAEVACYEGGRLVRKTVAALAKEAAGALRGGGAAM